ncbi:MarR family transcriptional regulator [Candidatus Contubernalis alkaliaceticus]|uniref:MarR family transcriptional regulator n=1 Tax=Candidatus Contubernalis alkaliaceticus TaxID=338645 RepID=UPI001F4BF9D6|nr:winged helix-turn-helix transcriptional regulator [Candidatus Contubernalis alkalaceticus]UNC93570.1 winged helix-turn-helix transcriptional regulator [Candidatus Contubernalis alkalaceticus]
MEKEYEVLSHLGKEKEVTQRKIASGTGLSLGSVNILLKKMVKKGLVKIERLNTRTIRYILTPRGMKEKARITYHYISNSYRLITGISNNLEEIIGEKKEAGITEIYLYGEKDDVYSIIVNVLNNHGFPYEFISDIVRLKRLIITENKGLIIIWDVELDNEIPENIEYINVLELI